MFCSWKKSLTAPCSCAYQLRCPITELLNHLCYLGQGTLVMRQQGLSLAKTTPFGLAVASKESGWNILRDQVSGLEVDTSQPQNIYLMTDAANRRPLLAMGQPDKPIELSIRLDGYAWESPAVTALLRRCDAISLDCAQSRRLGAGAWLDEWGEIPSVTGNGALVQMASDVLRNCELLEVEIQTSSQRSVTRFSPTFIDSEGAVMRIADRSCRHVVYADVDAPEFRMERCSSSRVKIFREPSAAVTIA